MIQRIDQETQDSYTWLPFSPLIDLSEDLEPVVQFSHNWQFSLAALAFDFKISLIGSSVDLQWPERRQ